MPAAEKKDARLMLERLPGISAKRAALLRALKIENQRELLFYFPRAYDDWSERMEIGHIRTDGLYTFRCQVASAPQLQRRGRLCWVSCRLADPSGAVDAIWFNQAWMKQKLKVGDSWLAHGKVNLERGRLRMVNPWLVPENAEGTGGMLPLYGLKQGLTQKILRDAVQALLEGPLIEELSDPLPEELRAWAELAGLEFALKKIHFPDNGGELRIARRRLAFEELFLNRMALKLMREKRSSESLAYALRTSETAREGLEKLRGSLPFSLTPSQMSAINEILRDLRQERPMNRLLQGDVGSGKTMVAAFAMAYAALCGGQAMMMAPTSILAEQHRRNLEDFFSPLGISVDILTSSSGSAERRRIMAACADGSCRLLVGTHALLREDLLFKKLVLAVTDEQHRFGVRQRSRLGEGEGRSVHRLVMSATPIPRTLALILYGDLDLSIMRDMPAGRQEIKTYIVRPKDDEKVERLLHQELKSGGQIYVVCPRIEESEDSDLESVESVYERFLRNFPETRVGLLHGQMKAEEKDELMASFLKAEIGLLVSTTVVEVGVDNPNASLILILNAERFGLAQLHQLRGRVGRGSRPSHCLLRTENQDPLSLERLQCLCRHRDGFDLAEEDLRLRGPGDFFGTDQHGLPAFRLVNLYEDQEIMDKVEAAMERLAELKGEAREKILSSIRQAIFERYPQLAEGLTL